MAMKGLYIIEMLVSNRFSSYFLDLFSLIIPIFFTLRFMLPGVK